MNITDVFRELSYSKFSNLALGNDGDGTIATSAQPRILLAVNEGLLRLHTRFLLRDQWLLLQLVDYITHYHLDSRFSESAAFLGTTTQRTAYIKDMVLEPFSDDVVRILSVEDEFGQTFPLNDAGDKNSLHTPQGKVLQVPYPESGRVLAVQYQARHPNISSVTDDLEIRLPDCLHEALRCYVAYQVFSGIATQEATIKAQESLAMYNAVCQDVVDHDLVSTSVSTSNVRFNRNGWI